MLSNSPYKMHYLTKLFYAIITSILVSLIAVLAIVIQNYISSPRISNTTTANLYTPWTRSYLANTQYLEAMQKKGSRTLFNFWINETGPTGPIFSGPQQYPFICTVIKYNLGQPIIDNNKHEGIAVFPQLFGLPLTFLPPVGFSKNCSIDTRVDYFYFSDKTNHFEPLSAKNIDLSNIAKLKIKGHLIPFIVRLERGSINRFIYSIALLAPYPEVLDSPSTLDNSAWNGKLVYKFQGGIGIGHSQGLFSLNKSQALYFDALSRGFAVAYSTGTRTTTHYNLVLAEETAMMVKLHFEATYGKPQYTIGIGGSGGAIQQHALAQNNPGIIDAAIPQASFPDMITQAINIPDCELLERYFDEEYAQNNISRWRSWPDRILIEGTNANNTAITPKWLKSPAPKPGSSECIVGWRGTVPVVFNPNWTHPAYYSALRLFRFPESVITNIKWTHWNDLANIYPSDKNGYAPNSWDNVGVQYGLKALNQKAISTKEFLDINACIGGWKQPNAMVAGYSPWNRNDTSNIFDPWDKANMNLSSDCKTNEPAPRTEGNITAMRLAYQSGHVFKGKIEIPIIDVRWYLEPILDMHHSIASFATRARIISQNGHADNQVIWIAKCSDLDEINLKDNCQYNPSGDALDVIDHWMQNIIAFPAKGVVANKPLTANDACFDGDGTVLYTGSNAWDGILNDKPKGKCTTLYPVYSTSRMVAGDNITGNTFKCALKPVNEALKDGTYDNIEFTLQELHQLKTVFPLGVCDYKKPDRGLPLLQ